MPLQVKRLGRTFFAEVSGLDLRQDLSDDTIAEIRHHWMREGVLLFRNQQFTTEEQVAYSKRFGKLEHNLRDDNAFVAPLGNLDQDGKLRDPNSEQSKFLRANQLWHSDSAYFAAPAMLSFLNGRVIDPDMPDGHTQWADMLAAYEDLPQSKRDAIEELIAMHDMQTSRSVTGRVLDPDERKKWPPVYHRMTRIHEETGKKVMYVGSQATTIVGWNDDAKSKKLFVELMQHATQDKYVYDHKWTKWDFVCWDNRRVVHRQRPFDEAKYPRVVFRSVVEGTGPDVIDGKGVNEFERFQALHGDRARILAAAE
jgi:alpha-ketoglutarate-dependent 2,4-dichlorophenoxyacetate dioxygenase